MTNSPAPKPLLAGSTASTLLAFILPAAIFLSVTTGQRGMLGASVDMLRGEAGAHVWAAAALLVNEWRGCGRLGRRDRWLQTGGWAASECPAVPLRRPACPCPPNTRLGRAGTNAWRQRRRMAGALLLFGCLAGVLCTQALVVSIREEHEVVQLAQVGGAWGGAGLARAGSSQGQAGCGSRCLCDRCDWGGQRLRDFAGLRRVPGAHLSRPESPPACLRSIRPHAADPSRGLPSPCSRCHSQELVREETKVAVAAQTEAKAKAMAEAVATVVQAAQVRTHALAPPALTRWAGTYTTGCAAA